MSHSLDDSGYDDFQDYGSGSQPLPEPLEPLTQDQVAMQEARVLVADANTKSAARVTKAFELATQARKDSEDGWMQLLLLGIEHDGTKEAAAELEADAAAVAREEEQAMKMLQNVEERHMDELAKWLQQKRSWEQQDQAGSSSRSSKRVRPI